MRHPDYIGIAVIAATLATLLVNDSRAQEEALYLRNKNYHLQTALYALYKPEQRDVVMLGNSLTQWVDWNELLGRRTIANRGIASDVTEGYLHRMHYVITLRPKLCFIEGGINDIYAGVPVNQVFANFVRIVDTLRAHNIIPVIQSTLYVSPKWRDSADKNRLVQQLNRRLEELAGRLGIVFLDLNRVLSSDGVLRDEFTYDGLHLNASGYAVWGQEVGRALAQHGL